MPISSEFPYEKKRATIGGREMAYVDTGEGDAIVLLHGNPTSSYLWRNVVPHLESLGRCIVPDLIGMGDSEKLPDSGPGSYTFAEHASYLYALLDQLDIGDRVVLVIHDWGSALGFNWAHLNPDRVAGIAYMEGIVAPVSWDDWPNSVRPIFQGFRSPAGEEMVLEQNVFVEGVLPNSVIRDLSDEEMAHYRAPFTEPGESRRPTLTWPRQIPIDGEPADVTELVQAYHDWLASSPVPKLLIAAEPGAILRGRALESARAFPNQREVSVPGVHFIQEDSPDEIGEAIGTWIREDVR